MLANYDIIDRASWQRRIMKRAFTLLELIFVIVVIGILATIAMPKFSATRDDAIITKAKNTVAAIRSAISNEVQKRMLQGNFTPIQDLGGSSGYNQPLFDYFDGNTSASRVLEYPIYSCKDSSATGCWRKRGQGRYEFVFPPSVGGTATFILQNNHFICQNPTSKECQILER